MPLSFLSLAQKAFLWWIPEPLCHTYIPAVDHSACHSISIPNNLFYLLLAFNAANVLDKRSLSLSLPRTRIDAVVCFNFRSIVWTETTKTICLLCDCENGIFLLTLNGYRKYGWLIFSTRYARNGRIFTSIGFFFGFRSSIGYKNKLFRCNNDMIGWFWLHCQFCAIV